METHTHIIIPDSDDEIEQSQDIFTQETSCTSTSSVSVNVHSLNYQNDISCDHNLFDNNNVTQEHLDTARQAKSRLIEQKSTNKHLMDFSNTTENRNNFADENNIPQEVLDEARQAESRLLPLKSGDKYEQQYQKFKAYIESKGIRVINEIVLMGYFNVLARQRVPGSLWSVHLMLKTTILRHHSVDISNFKKVTKFISANQKNSNHEKKKADTFTADEVAKFLFQASDYTWLATKVALILGLHGICRVCELYNLKTEHVEDHGTCLNFKLVQTKTGGNRSFTVTGEFCKVVKSYIALRPANVDKRNFFVRYEKGRCIRHVIGIHKIAEMPAAIAGYLKLRNPEKYTGHAFRRTGATLAANGGLVFTSLMKLAGWSSPTVAQGYTDNCMAQKNKVSALISNTITESAPFSSTGVKKTPLLISTSSTTVRSRPSFSTGQVQSSTSSTTVSPRPSSSTVPMQSTAAKTAKVNAEVYSPPHYDEVLTEMPMNTGFETALDRNPNINLHFHNCSGFNFFGNTGKENSK